MYRKTNVTKCLKCSLAHIPFVFKHKNSLTEPENSSIVVELFLCSFKLLAATLGPLVCPGRSARSKSCLNRA